MGRVGGRLEIRDWILLVLLKKVIKVTVTSFTNPKKPYFKDFWGLNS